MFTLEDARQLTPEIMSTNEISLSIMGEGGGAGESGALGSAGVSVVRCRFPGGG